MVMSSSEETIIQCKVRTHNNLKYQGLEVRDDLKEFREDILSVGRFKYIVGQTDF